MASNPKTAGTVALSLGRGVRQELNFVEEGPNLFLVASDPKAAWAREALRSPVRVLRADGREEDRLGSLVDSFAEVDRVLGAFRSKYGEGAWERYYRGRTRVLVLRETRDLSPRSAEAILRAEFDAVADGYTGNVEQNRFARYLRARSMQQFLPLFEGRDPILELGPGTGIETIELLRAGHRVIAVDLSPRMLDHLRRRADSAGFAPNLETRLGSVGDLGRVLGDMPDGTVGATVSTFGALNLEPNFERFPSALARLLAPGAPFFAGVLSRWALSTVGYLLLAGHPRDATQRMRNPPPFGGSLYPLEVQTYTGRGFAHLFRPWFVMEAVRSASVLAPPYWSPPLHAFWGSHGREALARLDARLSDARPFRDWGEYLFVTLRRNGTTAP